MGYGELLPLIGEDGLPALGIQRAAGSVAPPTPLYKQLSAGWHPLIAVPPKFDQTGNVVEESVIPLEEARQRVGPVRDKEGAPIYGTQYNRPSGYASLSQFGNVTRQALSDKDFAMKPQNRGELAQMMQIRANRGKEPVIDPGSGQEYYLGVDFENGGRRFGAASLPRTLGTDAMLGRFVTEVTPSLLPPNTEVGKYGINKGGYPWMSWKGGAYENVSPYEGGKPEPVYVAPTTPTTFPSLEWKPSQQASREDYLENTWPGVRKTANELASQLITNRLTTPNYDSTPEGQALIAKGQSLRTKLVDAQYKETVKQSRTPIAQERFGHYPIRDQAYGRNYMSPIYGETTDSVMEDYYKRAAAPGRFGVESFPNTFLQNASDEWISRSPALTEIETIHPVYAAKFQGKGMEPGFYEGMTRSTVVDPLQGMVGTRPLMVSSQMSVNDKYPEGWGINPPQTNLQTLAQDHAAAMEMGDVHRANAIKFSMDNAMEGALSFPSETELGVYPPSRPGESGKYLIGNVPQRIADPSTQLSPKTEFVREVPVTPKGQGEYYAIASEHERGLSGTPVTTYQQGGVRIPGRPSRTSRIDNSRALMSGIELKPVTTVEGGLAQEAANRGFAPNSDEAIRLDMGSRINSNTTLKQAQEYFLEPIESNDIVTSDLYRQGKLDNIRRQQMNPSYLAWQATPNDQRQAAVESLRQSTIERQAFNDSMGSRSPVQLSIPEVATIPASPPAFEIQPRAMDIPSGGGYRLPEGYGVEKQLAIPGLHEEMAAASRNAQADSLRARAAKLMRMKGLA